MDRRSWLWRRKSSASLQKSPGETDSSGSVSSERYSDDQEALRSSPVDSPSSHAQESDIPIKNAGSESEEAVKHLNEKLSAALLSISAKEELVKQHAKIAEEAVLGWEKAESEVASLKEQLEAVKDKNSSLEDRISHLDGALKECVRQLRQSRDEQEQKVHNAIIEKSRKWESLKSELEIQLVELQAKLEAKAESTNSISLQLSSKFEALENENATLKIRIATLSEDLQLRTLEMDLSTRAAETASKQHLESIRKIARLESECRRLQAAARRSSSSYEQKLIYKTLYVESTTDSQSDIGERLHSLDNEPSCSDSWASTLIVGLDQFKNENRSTKDPTTSADIDDFLEMEKLAALPEVDHASSSFDHETDLEHEGASSSKSEIETLRKQMAELEGKFEKMVILKSEMEMSLANTDNQLKDTCNKLVVAEGKVAELQIQLNLVNGEKYVLETELEAVEANRNEMESQLECAQKEIDKLQFSITSLERRIEEEKRLTLEFTLRSQGLDAKEADKNKVKLELESAYEKIAELHDKIRLLEGKHEVEKMLSVELASKCRNVDLLLADKMDLESKLESSNLELSRLHEKADFFQRKCEAVETKMTELEYQLSSANLELLRLKEKATTLETQVEEERSLSAELFSKAEMSEFKRKELVMLLESANKEIKDLQNKLSILEDEVTKEKCLSNELEAKCSKLEYEFSRRKEVQQPILSASAKIRQENEIATAAGRFAECQKTIASLNKQLKLLASLDDINTEIYMSNSEAKGSNTEI